jgi:ankyrin repeat protein
MVLTKALSPAEDEAFRIMFAQTQDFEDRNFTVLHEIVLGLTNRSLAEELKAETTDVNAQDGIGLTALSMAAKRGDAESVKLLLINGADPNIPSHSGKDALCYATKQNDRECILLLLNGGAKATNSTVYQQTALHFAALRSRDKDVADRLLRAGSDTNAADRDGRTPLGFTPLHNNFEFAAWLLEHGASIRCPGSSPAHDPLIQAIRGNRHELLELFIRHGFDIDVPLPNGQTLLHYIAEWADERTMALMSQCKVGRLMVGKEDSKGKTALDIIRKRGEDSPLVVECFFRMLESSLTEETEGDDKKSQASWSTGATQF